MRILMIFLCFLVLFTSFNSLNAATPLPAHPFTISKYLGTTRPEEIMLNRIVPYAGAHIGGVHVDTRSTPPRFYLFDSGNNRILGFKGWKPVTLPDGPFPSADIVIGQPALWDAGSANGDNTHFRPPTAASLALLPFPYVSSTAEAPRSGMMTTDDAGNFYVVDLNNNRVLKYIDPFATDQIADDVWGQTSFTNRSPDNTETPPPTSATTLRTQWNYGTTIGAFSAGVDVDSSGNIWVADSFNNRVIRFPAGAKTADLVLGQSTFTTSGTGTGLNQMYHPMGVRVHPDSGEVFVIDGQDNNPPGPRILVFSPPFSNGMSADRQFGEDDLSWARGFCLDPFHSNIVWVADGYNNRIVKFDHITGAALDCIGQPDLTTFMGIGKYVRPDGSTADFKQPDGSICIDNETNLYFTSFYGLNKVVKIPLPITRNGSGHVWSAGEMMKEGMNENSGRTMQDHFGMARWNNQLFIRDRNRVLVWTNYPAAQTFDSADLVIGQAAMDENDPGGTFEGRPLGMVHVAGDYLFVVSTWKLFIFDLPIVGGGRNYAPLKEIDGGQANNLQWIDDNSDARPIRFSGVCYDPVSNVLWIAHNHYDGDPGSRVLRVNNPFASIPKIDLVLGQTNKTAGLKNKGKYSPPYTVDGTDMANPSQVFLDNYRNLYVVDSGYEGRIDNGGNRRVVRFDEPKTRPVAGNIFPNYSADAVFCKSSLSEPRTAYEANRPGTPITVSFSESNVMALSDDTYDPATEQGMRVFLYPTPHVGATPQPTEIVDTYVGQPAFSFWDGDMFVLQDHTWNRIYFHLPSHTAPFIDITNDVQTLTQSTVNVGGIQSNIVGTLWWTVDTGGNGSIPATLYWSISGIPLVHGPNVITVSGTNSQGYISSDTLTITRDYAAGEGMPDVNITNSPAYVANSVSTYTIGGLANSHAVGALQWSTDKGYSGNTSAAESWVISGIPLSGGENIITVTATNMYGSNAVDTVTITRDPSPGEGVPEVTITTPNATVGEETTTYTIDGTNNTHVVGEMDWTNSKGGGGTLAATRSWSISGITLAMGDNDITVSGTNVYGDTSSDTVRITRENVITNATWQELAVTNGIGYSGAGNGLRMNEKSALVKNYDNDGYIYLQAHASAGNPQTQSVWRIRASTLQSEAPDSWELVIGGIPCNNAGGENGQTWVKFNDVFYTAMWAQFGVPNGSPWYWSWYAFYTTNTVGVAAVPGVAPENPIIVRATGDNPAGATRNIGGIVAWNDVDDITAICTDRNDSNNGEDAQIRRWNGFDSLNTLYEQACENLDSRYGVCVWDTHVNGRALFLEPYASGGNNAVWCATGVSNNYSSLTSISATYDIPGSMTTDAVTDMALLEDAAFGPNVLLAASVWTTTGRKIYLYNLERADLSPMDITPASGLNQWRNRLAASGGYLFMSYDNGGETPGIMRLSLLEYDLSPLGIPEPALLFPILLGIIGIGRKVYER